MLARDMTVLALALLAAAAVAFTRQRRAVLLTCCGLFVPAATAATAALFWPRSPVFTVLLLAVTIGPSLLALLLFWVDRTFAPFCVEMTYPAMLLWLLWPLLVAVDAAGLVVLWLAGAGPT